MSRNASGVHSLPNSITAGETLSAAPVQANFADLSAEVTASLPRAGTAGMTAPLPLANGSASLPGLTFASDTNTGFYRKSADVIGVAAGGVEVGSMDASGYADASGNRMTAFPAGTAMLFAQTAAPTGWTKSTTHNDKALRVVSGTASSGGTTAFTSVFAARTLVEANLPSHTHSVTGVAASDGAHTHNVTTGTIAGTSTSADAVSGGGTALPVGTGVIVIASGGAHTHTVTGTAAATGSGTAVDFAVQYVDVIIATKDA